MNKKFGVKIIYTAKDNNPNFKGVVLNSVYGKKGEYEHITDDISVESIVARIGWDREYDAKRFIQKDKHYEEYYWTTSYEIISTEV